MNRTFTLIFITSFLLFQLNGKAQFDFSQIEYWVGSGSDSSALIVDFHDGTSDSSYVWGVLFNNSTDGTAMINAVAAADVNFTTVIGSGFLSDIVYNSHTGVGGTPNYWSTWSGTDMSNLAMNGGVSTTVNNGDIFACSYTDFNPAVPPGAPIPAFNPTAFTTNDVQYFVGSGTDTAIFIIDFQTGNDAFAWGYVFTDSTTGNDILNALCADDPDLACAMAGGFLNDITYKSYSGLGGSPNYWSTWSATNMGNWAMNLGTSTKVVDGDIFGCSYTDFAPALRPGTPTAATKVTYYDFSQIEYWVGSGNDSCALVLDFHDGTSDTSYVWGILFNDSTNGEDMLNTVAAADINFNVAIASGFLSDITYGAHSGIGGTPNYWMTYTGTDISNLSINMGIGSVIKNKEIFACNYSPVDVNYNPIYSIGDPIPAFDPQSFKLSDLTYFIGSGSDTAVLIIDFQNGNDAFAWGYLFTDSTSGEQMLNDITADDPNLSSAAAGGFLNDINYYAHSGIGGSPNYWSTWSASNPGNWTMNLGLSTVVKKGEFFGCSYTDFMPALRPNTPVAAPNTTAIANADTEVSIQVYPNPASDYFHIQTSALIESVRVISSAGSIVKEQHVSAHAHEVNIHDLAKGIYIVQIQSEGKIYHKTVIKK